MRPLEFQSDLRLCDDPGVRGLTYPSTYITCDQSRMQCRPMHHCTGEDSLMTPSCHVGATEQWYFLTQNDGTHSAVVSVT